MIDRTAAASFPARTSLMLLGLAALLIALRLPEAWIQGRFQDEEATVFLAYAWHFPGEALFRPFAGYLNLGATAPTAAVAALVRGGLLPLEQAPYVTMATALLVQLLPVALMLTGKAPWLGRWQRLAGLAVVALPAGSEEVWLNVMHIQFHLTLAVALLLALDWPEGRAAQTGHGLILFLAPLCGPGAIILLPLFVIRAASDRDARRLVQAVPLAIGAAIQLLMFYEASPIRVQMIDPVSLGAGLFGRAIVLPFAGPDAAAWAGRKAVSAFRRDGLRLWLFAGLALLFFAGLAWAAWRRRDGSLWLLLSGLGIGGATLAAGIATRVPEDIFLPFSGTRYNFLPVVLLGLCFVALAGAAGRRGWPAKAGLSGILLVGAVSFFRPPPALATGPDWRAEVRQWRQNPSHELAVWPAPWRADLSNRPARCALGRALAAHPTAPRYCEEGWRRSFDEAESRGAAQPRTRGE